MTKSTGTLWILKDYKLRNRMKRISEYSNEKGIHWSENRTSKNRPFFHDKSSQV